MAEKKFADKLDRRSYVFGVTIANNFLRSGVKSFNHEVFYKLVIDTNAEEGFGIIPETEIQIVEKLMEKIIPAIKDLNSAGNICEHKTDIVYPSLCVQQMAKGGYFFRGCS